MRGTIVLKHEFLRIHISYRKIIAKLICLSDWHQKTDEVIHDLSVPFGAKVRRTRVLVLRVDLQQSQLAPPIMRCFRQGTIR